MGRVWASATVDALYGGTVSKVIHGYEIVYEIPSMSWMSSSRA